MQIVVLQRGWVVVGQVERTGEYLHITEASVVRRWGTTKGLGQLAAEGPRPATILDPAPNITAHVLTVVMTIDCVAEKWATK